MSMSHQETVEFVESLYAGSMAGDWDTVAGMLTDDFVAVEADGLPMAGRYTGKNGLKDLYIKVMGMVDAVALDREAIAVAEDCAVVLVTIKYADPSLAASELCELFRFRDGKCCEIKPYYFEPSTVIAACEAKKATA